MVDGPLGTRRRQGERNSLSRAGQASLPSEFDKGFRSILGQPPSDQERATFLKYLNLLIEWGSVYRLIGSTDPDWIVEHLFLDSLLFLKLLPRETRSILDFGAGAGLPGIPIAIVRPEVEISLLEARQRRASFLRAAVRELEITWAHVLPMRAEDAEEELAGRFDAVVVRCAGRLEQILPRALRFARSGGLVVAAGPPKPSPLILGQWMLVPGVRAGDTRRFAVLTKAPTSSGS